MCTFATAGLKATSRFVASSCYRGNRRQFLAQLSMEREPYNVRTEVRSRCKQDPYAVCDGCTSAGGGSRLRMQYLQGTKKEPRKSKEGKRGRRLPRSLARSLAGCCSVDRAAFAAAVVSLMARRDRTSCTSSRTLACRQQRPVGFRCWQPGSPTAAVPG